MIVKDEAERIERCIASVRPHVAELAVYDTGSTDATLEILERIKTEPGPPLLIGRGRWRDDFAWARQRSFERLSRHHKWVLWLDADDVLLGGEHLGQAAALAEQNRRALVFVDHGYDWIDGARRYTPRARIVHRKRGRWEGIVHEDFRVDSAYAYREAQGSIRVPREVMRVDHQHDTAKAPGHYLPLLEKAAQDTRNNPRAFYFLGREYAALERWDESLRATLHYLNEQHDTIEGDPNPFRLMAFDQAIGAAEHAEPAMVGWLRHERENYAKRIPK